jgi:G3E family GTPase
MRPEFRNTLRLDAIVALADAEQFSIELFDSVAARNQLRHADAILINKCDCVDTGRLVDVEGQIRSLNPQARLARTVRSAVPLPLILDVALFSTAQVSRHSDGHEHHRHEAHLEADGFISLYFESERPFSVSRFQSFLDTGRPPGLFRGKGFLQIAETANRYVFHLVGGRFSLEIDNRADRGFNRLVLIGRDFDLQDLRVKLQGCLADA